MADTTPQTSPPQPPATSAPAETAVPVAETPVQVAVNTEPVVAQVAGEPAPPVEQIPVHEVHVVADKVITDTKDPLAVQVPAGGIGDALTPIGAAFENAKTPEDIFRAAE